jgi:hypothetical protein
MRIHVVLGLLVIALAGCDTGHWVEVPGGVVTCAEIESQDFKKDFKDKEGASVSRGMFGAYCAEQGTKFTGGLRCANDKVMIKCK